MSKSDSTFTTEFSESQNIFYYNMIRDTVHSLDKLIVTVIYQSVTFITGSLTLSILFFGYLNNHLHSCILGFFLTIIAFLLTFNSERRIKLYTSILGEHVKVAERIEDLFFKDDGIKVTKQIEKNVNYAGMKGEAIFLRSIKLLYLIEVGLLIYFLINAIIMGV